jgi:hypothetical protein
LEHSLMASFFRLFQIGQAEPIKRGNRKLRKERKNRAKKFRGTAKVKGQSLISYTIVRVGMLMILFRIYRSRGFEEEVRSWSVVVESLPAHTVSLLFPSLLLVVLPPFSCWQRVSFGCDFVCR